jgi:integrase
MSLAEAKKLFSLFEQRERLVVELVVLTGMRPGEIFGLTWGRLQAEYAEIRQAQRWRVKIILQFSEAIPSHSPHIFKRRWPLSPSRLYPPKR